jgi:spoIIIJ-associated protein
MSMPDDTDIIESARGILEQLLDLLEVSASVEPVPQFFIQEETDATAGICLDVRGEDLGILIGRRGQTLSCLQYIVRLIVGYQKKVWIPIIIDVEGYKRRRYEALQALAWRMAEQVKIRKMPFTLEPMTAFDRRIIHLTLASHPEVTTQSSGEGEARKVVILPREQLT